MKKTFIYCRVLRLQCRKEAKTFEISQLLLLSKTINVIMSDQFQPYVGNIKNAYIEELCLGVIYVQEVCCWISNMLFRNEYITKVRRKSFKTFSLEITHTKCTNIPPALIVIFTIEYQRQLMELRNGCSSQLQFNLQECVIYKRLSWFVLVYLAKRSISCCNTRSTIGETACKVNGKKSGKCNFNPTLQSTWSETTENTYSQCANQS